MSKKTLFFDNFCGYNFSATVEDGKICEFNFELEERLFVVGNIYKGKITAVLPGMQACFVDCGLERNCYLSLSDCYPDTAKYEGEKRKKGNLVLEEGNEIMVQVIKPAVGKKGAKVTAFPSFVGKHVIYLPNTGFAGVSRKISDSELRKNLLFTAGKLVDENEGIVFRTASPYAKLKTLQTEIRYLKNLYFNVEKAFREAKTGDLLYTEFALPVRILRDTLSSDIEKIVTGTDKLGKLISELVNLYPTSDPIPVIQHTAVPDMLDEYGLSQQVLNITARKIPLENGGDIVIEPTEALTVIDVNTGKFTGDDNLEQTVYYTNILAAREIARQVRLRNIGGIIVVDFIDMLSDEHKKALTEELKRELKKDSAKCETAQMSKFGLIEFTRKRTGSSLYSKLVKPCRHCNLSGSISPNLICYGLRAKILRMFSEGEREIRIDLSSELLEAFDSWQSLSEELKIRLKDAKVYIVKHRSYPIDKISYKTDADCFPLPDNAIKLV